MEEPRIDRLSNRHRDVLRGVAALRKTKQIAAELGIAPGTVDGYIADAVRILGATDRGDAARMLARHERIDPLSDPRAPGPGQSGGNLHGWRLPRHRCHRSLSRLSNRKLSKMPVRTG
ncbi:helix-turn-helix transcriptional regulator [Sphingomonas sp. LR59]|uniref:helix-turn-helix domain-containing protein n=1 Tax=Sphingomonas sp. LR59 TaxID=3050232 RepID=UPI002FE2961B